MTAAGGVHLKFFFERKLLTDGKVMLTASYSVTWYPVMALSFD